MLPKRKPVLPDDLYKELLVQELLHRATQRDPLAPVDVLGRVPEGLVPAHRTEEKPISDDFVSLETKAQIATTMLADEGIRTETGRRAYGDLVRELEETDSDKREAIKKAARIKHTPPFMRAVIHTVRPDPGAKPGSGGTANRTNKGWNTATKVIGAAGKGNALLGAGLGAWRIKNAEDKAREAAIVSGEVGGTLAGALLGAKLGLIGGPYGSALGALAGGIGGGLLGGEKVEDFYEWVTD